MSVQNKWIQPEMSIIGTLKIHFCDLVLEAFVGDNQFDMYCFLYS